MRPQAIAQAAAVLACCAGAGAAPAGQGSPGFAVRLQVLSTCRVSAPSHPGVPAASDRALRVHCSRQTPFIARLPAPASTGVAATGRGMDQVSAVLPAGEAAAGDAGAAQVTAVHVDY